VVAHGARARLPDALEQGGDQHRRQQDRVELEDQVHGRLLFFLSPSGYEHCSCFRTRFPERRPVMAKHRQVPEAKRRIPRQARAGENVAAVLEAAAQILEASGLAGFTTNAVAERAGVSSGTLYQYFADKDAVLRAIAE